MSALSRGNAMRIVLGVLVGFAAGVVVGWVIGSSEEGATPDPVEERVERPPADAPPPRLEPPVLRPVPDPAATTPRPGTPARRRAPDAPARLPVDVEVVGPGRLVADDVKVYWARSETSTDFSWMQWRPPTTSLYTELGDIWVHATGGSHDGYRSEPVHVVVTRDGMRPSVRLVLEERPGIFGRVILPGEFDRPRITVRLKSITSATAPENPVFDRTRHGAYLRKENGYLYAFHNLEPGYYLVGLSLGRDEVVVVETVHVTTGMVEQDLVIEAFDPAVFVEVTVLGPDGKRLRDVQVSACFRGKNQSVAGGNVELVREDGTVIINHNPKASRDAEGRYVDESYTLNIRHPEHGEIVRSYDPNARQPVTIRYYEQAVVALRLQDYAESPMAGRVLVGIRDRASGQKGVQNPLRPSPDGRLEFGQRQPGTYDLLVLGPNHRLCWMHPFEVVAGENVIDVPLPEFHTLDLHFPADTQDPRFSLRRSFEDASRWSYHGETKEPGVRTYELLTAGTYEFEGYLGERRVLRTVTIPADRVLRID